jgi:CO/xanthine dehydrogenase FAD-binding subunit
MKVDPIALRKRWDPNPNRQRLYDWAAGLEVWRNMKTRAPQTGRYRRGVGVATGYWLYLWQPGVKIELAVESGRLVAKTATQDIGQGSRTVIANTVAREFGLEPHDIEVRIGDSNLPEGPGAGGSRSTASVVPPTLLAVRKLKDAIEQHAKRRPVPGSNAPWQEMIAASPDLSVASVRPEDSRPTSSGVRSPLKEAGFMGVIFGWMLRRFSNLAVGAGVPSSVQVIEVEVDTWLGHVRVLNVHTGIAGGKIAAPALARSQATGSVIQGLGYALYEARELDPHRGDILSAGMEDYRIPGIADTPEIDVHFDEAGFDHVLGGSVGIGEVATVPTSPALANAILMRIGVRLTRSIRPDRRVSALKGGPQHDDRIHHRSAAAPNSRRRHSISERAQRRHGTDRYRSPSDSIGSNGAGMVQQASVPSPLSPRSPPTPCICCGLSGHLASALGLATPQIRHSRRSAAIAQRSRCWYFRDPHIACLKKGGSDCPARSGNHLYSVAFDLGPCVAPHPSTMAAALLAYDVKIVTNQRPGLSIDELLGDGSDGTADNALASGEIIRGVELPAPLQGERAFYKRAISRSHAEWPLVEVCARAVVTDGTFQFIRITAGGIAPIPLRLSAAEAALQGKPANTIMCGSCKQATAGANPLPMTIRSIADGVVVRDLLEQLHALIELPWKVDALDDSIEARRLPVH